MRSAMELMRCVTIRSADFGNVYKDSRIHCLLSVWWSVCLLTGRRTDERTVNARFLFTMRHHHTYLINLLQFFMPRSITSRQIPVDTKQQEEKTFRTLTFLKPLAVHSLIYALLLNEFAVRIFLLAVSFIILLQDCRLSHFRWHDRIISARILWFSKELSKDFKKTNDLAMARHLPVMHE